MFICWSFQCKLHNPGEPSREMTRQVQFSLIPKERLLKKPKELSSHLDQPVRQLQWINTLKKGIFIVTLRIRFGIFCQEIFHGDPGNPRDSVAFMLLLSIYVLFCCLIDGLINDTYRKLGSFPPASARWGFCMILMTRAHQVHQVIEQKPTS